jgi:hypothetical protein
MSESITVKGTVETVLPLETFNSGFTKRVLVVLTDDKYPQTIPVEFIKDKAEVLTGLVKGQEVTAYVNLRGSEYNGKYYANIQGWKLDKGEVKAAPKPQPGVVTAPAGDWDEDESDSIPF